MRRSSRRQRALLRPLGGVTTRPLFKSGGSMPQAASATRAADFLDYRQTNTVMSGVRRLASRFPSSGGEPSGRGEMSGNYFDVLGVGSAGRLMTPADDEGDRPNAVAVVSFRLWQQRFAANARAIGSTVKLDGRPYAVIGVAEPMFAGTRVGVPRDVWLPIRSQQEAQPEIAIRLGRLRLFVARMFGQLKPGVTIDQARTGSPPSPRGWRSPTKRTRTPVLGSPGLGAKPTSNGTCGASRATVCRRHHRARDRLRQCRRPVAGARVRPPAEIAAGARRRSCRVIRQLLAESLTLAWGRRASPSDACSHWLGVCCRTGICFSRSISTSDSTGAC
jgi:hypothetical protein